MKKFILYSCIGDKSVHNQWVGCKERFFDIVLCYYGDDDTYYKKLEELQSESCIIYRKKGLKWPNFYEYCKKIDIHKYSHVWVPDDDIEIPGDMINRMFLTLEKNKHIQVAIPSTSKDSVAGNKNKREDHHHCKKIIEYKNFVECNLLCFHTNIFRNTLFQKLLQSTYTGYYFDTALQHCFSNATRHYSIAVLHNIIAKHPLRKENGDLDKVVPRHLHVKDIQRFIKNGIPRNMLQKKMKTYYVLYNKNKCLLCV